MKSHVAPLSGKVVEVLVTNSSVVAQGEPVLILESMKVHVKVDANVAGRVKGLVVRVDDSVSRGDQLFQIVATTEISPSQTQTLSQANTVSNSCLSSNNISVGDSPPW